MQNRKLQMLIAVVLMAFGVLVSATIDNGTTDPEPRQSAHSALDAPGFSIDRRPGRLRLAGTAVSANHESGLLQIVADQFQSVEAATNFQAGVLFPDRWETASMRLLYALAATDSARAELTRNRVEIRGVTSDAGMLHSRLEFLRESLPDDMMVEEDVIVANTAAPLHTLCHRNLAHAVTRPVAFRQSSAELRTSSFAILDRIVDVANDCRQSTILITGHSDASGNETWNRHLSLGRAQAVADYIKERGIPSEQLRVDGHGSSQPIADNATAHGRSLNRRIEFTIE